MEPSPAKAKAKTATAKGAGTSGLLGYLPWIGGGIVAGLITVWAMGVFDSSPPEPRPAPTGAEPAGSAPAASSEREAPTPSATADVPREEPSAAPSAEGVALPKAAMASLAEEMAALDAAHAALAAGDAPRALRAAEEYDRRFPEGMLAPDVMVVRIEALVRVGDRAGAERLGWAFIGAHPTSTHAARVRALLAPP
jgi:hypothetical protein